MEPLSALAIASAVIQIVDFSSKVIARTREVYLSTSGTTEENSLLEDATANLTDLMSSLKASTSQRFRSQSGIQENTPDIQLLQLADASHVIAIELRDMLIKVKLKKDGSERSVLDQGLRNALEQKKILALKEKLDEIRKQIDTTLLVSLRCVTNHHPPHEANKHLQARNAT